MLIELPHDQTHLARMNCDLNDPADLPRLTPCGYYTTISLFIVRHDITIDADFRPRKQPGQTQAVSLSSASTIKECLENMRRFSF